MIPKEKLKNWVISFTEINLAQTHHPKLFFFYEPQSRYLNLQMSVINSYLNNVVTETLMRTLYSQWVYTYISLHISYLHVDICISWRNKTARQNFRSFKYFEEDIIVVESGQENNTFLKVMLVWGYVPVHLL